MTTSWVVNDINVIVFMLVFHEVKLYNDAFLDEPEHSFCPLLCLPLLHRQQNFSRPEGISIYIDVAL